MLVLIKLKCCGTFFKSMLSYNLHNISDIFSNSIESSLDFSVFCYGLEVLTSKSKHFFHEIHVKYKNTL